MLLQVETLQREQAALELLLDRVQSDSGGLAAEMACVHDTYLM